MYYKALIPSCGLKSMKSVVDKTQSAMRINPLLSWLKIWDESLGSQAMNFEVLPQHKALNLNWTLIIRCHCSGRLIDKWWLLDHDVALLFSKACEPVLGTIALWTQSSLKHGLPWSLSVVISTCIQIMWRVNHVVELGAVPFKPLSWDYSFSHKSHN